MFESINENKALVRRVYEEMWNKGQPALAVELFEQPAGVERFVSHFLSSFPDLQHTVEEMIAEGDRVAVKFSARGTHTGPWQGVAPTGRPIQYSGITWARVARGRIYEHRTLWDKAGLMEQLGG